MEDKDGNKGRAEPETGFRFHEQLEVAKKDVVALYHPADDVTVYRTLINNPPNVVDFTAQIYREQEEESVIPKGWTKEEYDKSPEKDKQGYISERTLSVNDTRENAIKAAKRTYQYLKKKFGTDYAVFYIEKERGPYVGEILLKPGQALISDFKDGHGEVILNEDISWTEVKVSNIEKYNYKDE